MDRKERRQHDRFNTAGEFTFQPVYAINASLNFQIVDKTSGQLLPAKYSAASRNVNLEGLSFDSNTQLQPGDRLYMEIHLPSENKPTILTGDVRWSSAMEKEKGKFSTGCRVETVNNKNIQETFVRETNRIIWSGVLEAIIGDFKGNYSA